MEFRARSPRNPIEWILAVLIFGVVLALGFLLMGVVIVVVAVAVVAAPVISWWRRKKGVVPPSASAGPSRVPSPDPTPEPDDLDGPIVDAEFHVKDQ